MHKLILALLFGVGLTALGALLLNIPSSGIALLASLLLAPGGILASLFVRSQGLGSPLALLAANAFIYSALAFVALRFWIWLDASKAKRLTVGLTIAALILVGMAFIPSLSPIWPRGMTQLADEEKNVRTGLPVGSTLDAARAFLRVRAVDSHEYEIRDEEPILHNEHTTIVARPGDRLISAQIDTEAEQFPCSYKIQVALVFGADDRLREEYIERSPLCP